LQAKSLLYVGIAPNPLARLAVHGSSEWAADVTHVGVDWYRSRRLAYDAATLAVQSEKPYYNVSKRYPPRTGAPLRGVRTALYWISCSVAPFCPACSARPTTGLLSMGIARQPLDAIAGHQRTSWAQDVAQITIEYHATYREALAAETLAIDRERPLHRQPQVSESGPEIERNLQPAARAIRGRTDHSKSRL
jgi:hypothetical protein